MKGITNQSIGTLTPVGYLFISQQIMSKNAQVNTFTILYFASAGTLTKLSSETFEAPLSVSKLYQTLEQRYPGMQAKVLNSSALTINMDYIDLDTSDEIVIKPGDEVAIIPPVSSG